MTKAHPEVVWGVSMARFVPGQMNDASYMWISTNLSQFLAIKVGDDLKLGIFGLQSKTDLKNKQDLAQSLAEKKRF